MLRALFSFRNRFRILHLTWFAFFLSFVVWFSFAPFATTIQRELHLTAPQLKVLAICNLALTIPARIVIGMVLDRYGPRLTFPGLLIFAVVPCLLNATAQDFNQLVWSSLTNSILGAGFVAGVRMVAEWFPPKEIVYGGIYLRYTQDTPLSEVYQRPNQHGGLEVTSQRSFGALTLLDLGLLVSLGLLTYPLAQDDIHFLNSVQVELIWLFLGLLSAIQFYKSWQINREIVGSLNPFSPAFLRDLRHLTTAADIFDALVDHLEFSTNGGNIRSTISIHCVYTIHAALAARSQFWTHCPCRLGQNCAPDVRLYPGSLLSGNAGCLPQA